MRLTRGSGPPIQWRSTLPRVAGLLAAAAGLLAVSALTGCQSSGQRDYKPMFARFYVEATDGRGMTLTLPQSEVQITVNQQPVLNEGDFVNAEVAQVELGRCLAFQLSSRAARDCYRLTASHQGRRLVLAINGQALGARRIDGPIGDGVVLVFVEVPDSTLSQLVADLKRSIGALQRELGRK